MTQDKTLFAGFTQCPNIILYGLPHIPLTDRWVLLTLMGLTWDRQKVGKSLKELEGPYQLSLRQIASAGGVSHTSLRNKGGENPREGILDRLQLLGYVTIIDACPINEMTKSVGREQTYLYIHLEKIWQDNTAFIEQWSMPSGILKDKDSIVPKETESDKQDNIPTRIAKRPGKIIGRVGKKEKPQFSGKSQSGKAPAQSRLHELQSMPYSEYLKTPEWTQKRQKALRFAGFRCQLCNSADKLNVHHRTYERLGQELMGDLITLCNDCHATFHQNRELTE